MKRALTLIVALALAAAAGVGIGEWLYESAAFRNEVGKLTGRGQLLALTGGFGVYESDRDLTAAPDTEQLVIAANLRRAAAREPIDPAGIERELHLLRFQFGKEEEFQNAVRSTGATEQQLLDVLAEHLRAREWLERHIAPRLTTSDEAARAYYEANRDQFLQPQRYRVSHVFLAAPEGTPAPLIEEKRKAISALAARLAKGETIPALAAEASEDPATKTSGGDLNFFSAARMPEDFMAHVRGLSLGKPRGPVQTSLGFHLLELTDTRPETQLPFEQVREEIAAALRNERRAAAIDELSAQLGAADFLRPMP